MAAYTHLNLKRDVEDMAPQFGLADSLEARFAGEPLELQHAGLSYQRLEPGVRLPFGHKHAEQEEVYVVVSGSARAKLEDEVVELEQWDALRVAAATMRSFEAGPEGVELVVFGAPMQGGNDAELEQGWWPGD